MPEQPISIAELEQRRLMLLNGYLDGSHAYIRDGSCAYCGIRAVRHTSPLCEICEDRRQRLATRYPELTVGKMRHIAEFVDDAREWSPHNSE